MVITRQSLFIETGSNSSVSSLWTPCWLKAEVILATIVGSTAEIGFMFNPAVCHGFWTYNFQETFINPMSMKFHSMMEDMLERCHVKFYEIHAGF